MKVRFFDPACSYLELKPEIDAAMQDVLSRGDLILRKDVEEFERSLAAYVGTKYAVGVASGTDALILSLKAAGIKRGDKVLCPSYTFRATLEAIVHAGGEPVLYDIPEVFSIKDVRFILVAHIAGEVRIPPEFAAEMALRGITVIEDAAQAIGAAPVTGHAATYSFYPAKILGCYGDAGAVATNNKELYLKLLQLRNHDKGSWKQVAYNSRLDNLQAAVLNVKIKHLPRYIARRKEIAQMYDMYLKGVGLPAVREVYQDYIITHENRDGLKDYLAAHHIESLEDGYPFPEDYPKLPGAVAKEARGLRIPCNPDLTDEEVRYVIKMINAYGV